MSHPGIDVPKGGITCEDKSLATCLELGYDLLQMRLFLEVSSRIGGNQTVEVTANVSGPDGAQYIIYGVPRAEGYSSILEELDGIGNQAAFRHGEQIVQGFESLPPLGRSEGALAAVLLHEPRPRYLGPTLPRHGHLVRVRQVTYPTGFLINGQSPDAKPRIERETGIEQFDWIEFVLVSDDNAA